MADTPEGTKPNIARLAADAADAMLAGRSLAHRTWGLRSPRQIAFLRHYLVSRNGARAAMAAGYSESQARQQAVKMLKSREVQRIIADEDAKVAARFEITRERILQEAAVLAFSRIGDVVEWDNTGLTFVPKEDLPDHAHAAIQELSAVPGEHGTKRSAKLHDKRPYLEFLAKFVGLNQPTAAKMLMPDGSELESQGGIHVYTVNRFELPDNGRGPTRAPEPLPTAIGVGTD